VSPGITVEWRLRARRVEVRAKGDEAVRATLYDVSGKTVFEAAIDAGHTTTLPLRRELQAGTYVLRVKGARSELMRRISVF
jgi:hypothetical protein